MADNVAVSKTRQCNYRLPVDIVAKLKAHAEAERRSETAQLLVFIEKGLADAEKGGK